MPAKPAAELGERGTLMVLTPRLARALAAAEAKHADKIDDDAPSAWNLVKMIAIGAAMVATAGPDPWDAEAVDTAPAKHWLNEAHREALAGKNAAAAILAIAAIAFLTDTPQATPAQETIH